MTCRIRVTGANDAVRIAVAAEIGRPLVEGSGGRRRSMHDGIQASRSGAEIERAVLRTSNTNCVRAMCLFKKSDYVHAGQTISLFPGLPTWEYSIQNKNCQKNSAENLLLPRVMTQGQCKLLVE